MIANQTLGAPVSVTFTLHKPPTPPADGAPLEWRLSAADSGGGLFCDTGVHAVDIIEYVMVRTTAFSFFTFPTLSACWGHGRASRWWM